MLTKLKKELDSFYDVPGSDEDWEQFSKHLELRKYKKKDFILKQGETEKCIYLVQQGIVRLFTEKEKKEYTFHFSFSNDFITSYDSLINQAASEVSIQAVTNTYIYVIDFEKMKEFVENQKTASQVYQKSLENSMLKTSQRQLSLLINSPKELYLEMLEKEPHLVQQIPLKYLASYMGITPQALSRIRKQISL